MAVEAAQGGAITFLDGEPFSRAQRSMLALLRKACWLFVNPFGRQQVSCSVQVNGYANAMTIFRLARLVTAEHMLRTTAQGMVMFFFPADGCHAGPNRQ